MHPQNSTPVCSSQDIYDLTGKVFGPITVIRFERVVGGRRYFLVRCVCGTERVLPAYGFKSKAPHCEKCLSHALEQSGEASPKWLQDLGFSADFLTRFWPHVNKGGPVPAHMPHLGPCWIWTAGVTSRGRGCISAQRKSGRNALIQTHRASWIIHNGRDVPKELNVLHHCDTPRCCRPDHLFLGSIKDNSEDMRSKGRGIWHNGERHHGSVLTDAQVVEMRKLRKTAKATYKDLALMYRCSPSTVAWIIRGEHWRHLL